MIVKYRKRGSNKNFTVLNHIAHRPTNSFYFKTFEYKIGRKKYTSLTSEFQDEIKKIQMWLRLKNND